MVHLPDSPIAQRWLFRKGWARMLASAQRAELEQAILRIAIARAVLLSFADNRARTD